MDIPILSKFIQRAKDRANAAENQRLWKAELERKWADADRRHRAALADHKAACERHRISPTAENLAATIRCYERTWEPYNECLAIWRELMGIGRHA